MSHTIQLCFGDWSGDGHNQHDRVSVGCSHDLKHVIAAYEKAVKKLGVNPIENLCSEHEDHTIPQNFVDAFKANGIDSSVYFEEIEGDGGIPKMWNLNDWPELIMAVVKLGDPDIVFHKVDSVVWDIGGYGLFFS